MKFIYKLLTIFNTKCYFVCGLMVFFGNTVCLAQTIIIPPHTVISHSKTYNNVTIDMTQGSFVITNNATLTISNSIINGNLSKNNPTLIRVDKGHLNLSNNQVSIKAIDIAPHSTTQSEYYVIKMAMGGLNMANNKFKIDQAFTAGLLITTASIPTTNIKITNNKFERFHGVLYLISTNNALVFQNTLLKNTYGNIVIIGSNSVISGNSIYFSGNNRLGDSIDVIDSNDIVVTKNQIFTPTCHGIYLFNSKNVTVDQNKIFGGITYAMNVLTYPETLSGEEHLTDLIKDHKMKNVQSANITITNNFMSQNRYGIAASDTDRLNVSNNIFIQRFDTKEARKFWTDNNILFQHVTNLLWHNNFYKEAFTQNLNGSNNQSDKLVPFPQKGGVAL